MGYGFEDLPWYWKLPLYIAMLVVDTLDHMKKWFRGKSEPGQ